MLGDITKIAKPQPKTTSRMSNLLQNIAKLQMMLADMEADVGIRDIGVIEKSVLSAIVDLTEGAPLASTKEILAHHLNEVYSRPSLFRALKNLENLGRITKGGEKRGLYTLVDEGV